MTPPEKPSGDNSQGADGDAGTDDTRGDPPQMGGRPGESDGSTSESSSARRSNLIFYGVSAAVIAAAMIFVLAYRRRRRYSSIYFRRRPGIWPGAASLHYFYANIFQILKTYTPRYIIHICR